MSLFLFGKLRGYGKVWGVREGTGVREVRKGRSGYSRVPEGMVGYQRYGRVWEGTSG